MLNYNQDRLERVSRILSDEWRYQRYGATPTPTSTTIDPIFRSMAKMALLAADSDEAALEHVRATRDRWLQLILAAEPSSALLSADDR